MNGASELRPRWGTFSVISHKYRGSLIPEILLYDRLIFPVPVDDADRKRWCQEKWAPDELDNRLKELNDLAYPIPWNSELRATWSERWKLLKDVGKEIDGLAMSLTPEVLAMELNRLWQDRVPPPIIIAAYQSSSRAVRDIALIEEAEDARARRRRLHRAVCALFVRRMEMPWPERTREVYVAYDKAIELAHDKDYLHARRSLFEWEDRIVAGDWPTPAAIRQLDELIDAHDDRIKSAFRKTLMRRIFRVVEVASPVAAEVATDGQDLSMKAFAQFCVAGLLKFVEARLPHYEDPNNSAGAALHKAISVMYREDFRGDH